MYAYDLLFISEFKEIRDLLKITEDYGLSHVMKFNPEKTELLIFNMKVKRSSWTKAFDKWKVDLFLGGSIVQVANSLRYLGSILRSELSNLEHIIKKKDAAYRAHF